MDLAPTPFREGCSSQAQIASILGGGVLTPQLPPPCPAPVPDAPAHRNGGPHSTQEPPTAEETGSKRGGPDSQGWWGPPRRTCPGAGTEEARRPEPQKAGEGPRRLSKSDRVEDSNSTQTLPRFELQMSHWRRPAGPGAPGRGRCPQDSRPVSGSDSRGCPDGGLHGCHFTCLHSGDCHSPEPHPPGRCLGGRVTHQAGKERSQD